MNEFGNAVVIALYEARMLWRSWFFRIFAGVIALLTVGLNAMIFSVGQIPTWVFRAVPANIPYATVVLMNAIISIVAIILATDFMKRDRSMDTTDVVYIRSMTNTSYVLGKACGTLLVFFCLTAFSLLCAAAFNFLSGDVPVRWVAYGYYALLISAPTLVFCVGTTFFCMSIIRSQPLSLAALSCFFGLAFFFFARPAFFRFRFRGAPRAAYVFRCNRFRSDGEYRGPSRHVSFAWPGVCPCGGAAVKTASPIDDCFPGDLCFRPDFRRRRDCGGVFIRAG